MNIPSIPERKWVWSSTEVSIEKGQFSILAIAEIPLAMAFYYWISTISPWPWATWIGLMAAPLLLLKSPEVIKRSNEILISYLETNTFPKHHRAIFSCVMIVVAIFIFINSDIKNTKVAFIFYTISVGPFFWDAVINFLRNKINSKQALAIHFFDMFVFYLQITTVKIYLIIKFFILGFQFLPQNWREEIFIVDLKNTPKIVHGN
jgi:hypothetical protein